jgi:hypothetical protein
MRKYWAFLCALIIDYLLRFASGLRTRLKQKHDQSMTRILGNKKALAVLSAKALIFVQIRWSRR